MLNYKDILSYQEFHDLQGVYYMLQNILFFHASYKEFPAPASKTICHVKLQGHS